ncbi:ATP-dependent Clp protease ATP-binding subunit [Patescibacteria group bacterium]
MLDSKIFQKFTNHAKKSLEESKEIATYCNAKEVSLEHLLWAIYLEKGSLGSNILKDLKIEIEDFDNITAKNKKITKKQLEINLSKETKKAIMKALSLAKNLNYPYIGTEHLVYAIIENPNEIVTELISKKTPQPTKKKPSEKQSYEPSDDSLGHPIRMSLNKDFLSSLSKALNLPEIGFPMKDGASQSQTPSLDYFCTNLNAYAKKSKDPVIGRGKEIERIINTLGRKNKNNPLLIGEPGVGKTAIATGLAHKINSGNIPPALASKKILSLDIALVVAGTSFRGEFEQRLKDIIQEASENENIILFIDEIHSIVGAGNVNGGLDAANILKPVLSRGDIRCIGATTLDEYKKYIEKDPALERRFQPIEVQEPNLEDAKKILKGLKKTYEKYHNVSISNESIEKAVELSHKYIRDRFLPDKAIDILDETSSRIKNQKQPKKFLENIKNLEKELEKVITIKNDLVNNEKYDEALQLRKEEEGVIKEIRDLKKKQKNLEKKSKIEIHLGDIIETISESTKIPKEKLLSQKTKELKSLSRRLSKAVIGQNEAIEQINNTILRSQVGISNPDRPIGSFLLLGPTGVGKTLTAKKLADELFEGEKSLVRIDMSEFMERHNISQLIGAPAGYVGYGEGGKLTEKIRRNPYSIILFDEIEKAHPDVFNILLQILEEGTLTDSEGRSVNFKNTLIILTSNLGTEEFTSASKIGFASSNQSEDHDQFEAIKEKVLNNLKQKMKPEILNRLDHVIVFDALKEKDVKKIIKLELDALKKRLLDQKIKLSFSNPVINLIAKKSSSVEKGARMVRKNIQNMIEDRVAKEIVSNLNKDITEIALEVEKKKIVIQAN